MLSAHMDTVGKDTGIRPQIRDGIIYSDGTTILGGDDKSGVAAILEVLLSIRQDKLDHPPLEVVISVGEEVGLQGAKWLDKSKLRARQGYVLDSGGAIGSIVLSAPSQDSLRVVVHGKKAHAGSEPENGINAIRVASEAIAAMPLGRIDFETTANIGVIEGGTATNIVPDEVKIRGEARSRNTAKLAAQTAAMVRALEEAAAGHGTRADITVVRQYSAYRFTPETPVVMRAAQAAQAPRLRAQFTGTAAAGPMPTSTPKRASNVPCSAQGWTMCTPPRNTSRSQIWWIQPGCCKRSWSTDKAGGGGSVRAFLVTWKSLLSFYNEMFLFIGLSLTWWVTGGIFVVVVALAAYVALTGRRIVRAVSRAARRDPDGAGPGRDGQCRTPRLTGSARRPQLLLGGLPHALEKGAGRERDQHGRLALLLLNMVFYAYQQSFISILAIVFAYLSLFWLSVQLYIFPVLIGLKEPTVWGTLQALRRSWPLATHYSRSFCCWSWPPP